MPFAIHDEAGDRKTNTMATRQECSVSLVQTLTSRECSNADTMEGTQDRLQAYHPVPRWSFAFVNLKTRKRTASIWFSQWL